MTEHLVPVRSQASAAQLALLLQHRPTMISGMFDSIAERYDGLDRVLSAGLDDRWRAELIARLGLTGGEAVLDLCAGTGEVSINLRRAGAGLVTAVDFAPEMLRIAQAKALRRGITGIRFICGDVLHTPLLPGSMDAATMAFGLRNVEDPAAAVAEVNRVLRPGGRLAILELSRPSRFVRVPFLAYFGHVIPLIGRLVSHNRDAYRYLPESVDAFPAPDRVATLISSAGFEQVRVTPLSRGIAHCYTAQKPDSAYLNGS